MTSLVKVETQRFFDKDIHVLKYNDNDYFIAKEVAEALEYSESFTLANKVNDEWSDEFIEGTDFVSLDSEDLTEIRANFAQVGRPVQTIISPKARSLMLLSETGVQIACLKSQTKKAIEFRRWVATILSDMRRGNAPLVEKTKTGTKISTKERALDIQLEKIKSHENIQKSKVMLKLIGYADKYEVDKSQIQVMIAHTTGLVTGQPVQALLPPQETEKFYSPTEMAHILNISPQKVGKILKELKLHGEMTKDNNKALLSKAKGKDNPKAVPVFVYNVSVLDALKNHLKTKQMGLLELTSGSDSQDGLDLFDLIS